MSDAMLKYEIEEMTSFERAEVIASLIHRIEILELQVHLLERRTGNE